MLNINQKSFITLVANKDYFRDDSKVILNLIGLYL